ncbi:MAG: glycosyltransferase family 4 protein [Gammaproteobacteria bacterium]
MKILKVIHGYPPRYNAGSEVYSQTLCRALVDAGHQVSVFSRYEDPFAKDFTLKLENDIKNDQVSLNLVNITNDRLRYRYTSPEVDSIFSSILDEFSPDVIHIGHLNHLSTSLINKASSRNIPIVYTLHDYWIMCPRGQFLQRNSVDNVWAVCHKQEDQKCANTCYSGYFSGDSHAQQAESIYWTSWIANRMQHMRELCEKVSMFIAPSRYLLNRYLNEFKIPEDKLVYMDYGFDISRLGSRKRVSTEPFTFGYIGTHIPAKGIQDLISAFARLKGSARLKIWGRSRGQNTEALQSLVNQLESDVKNAIEWVSEYENDAIVEDVFNHVDCIVVPSIWVENSPLVIHEALQARVPVITADIGGMAEYITHEKNGLLFKHRDSVSLANQMQRFVDNPEYAKKLGQAGYLQSENNNVIDINDQVKSLEKLYQTLIG